MEFILVDGSKHLLTDSAATEYISLILSGILVLSLLIQFAALNDSFKNDVKFVIVFDTFLTPFSNSSKNDFERFVTLTRESLVNVKSWLAVPAMIEDNSDGKEYTFDWRPLRALWIELRLSKILPTRLPVKRKLPSIVVETFPITPPTALTITPPTALTITSTTPVIVLPRATTPTTPPIVLPIPSRRPPTTLLVTSPITPPTVPVTVPPIVPRSPPNVNADPYI